MGYTYNLKIVRLLVARARLIIIHLTKLFTSVKKSSIIFKLVKYSKIRYSKSIITLLNLNIFHNILIKLVDSTQVFLIKLKPCLLFTNSEGIEVLLNIFDVENYFI